MRLEGRNKAVISLEEHLAELSSLEEVTEGRHDASCSCTNGSCRDEKICCHLCLGKERKGWNCSSGYIMGKY